jgi:nucleotide-binding universal stress UspA family protein
MIDDVHEENRRIVVGIDTSRGSRAALRWALAQARLSGATVEAVTAWQDPVVYGYSYGWVPSLSDADSVPAFAEKAVVEAVADAMGTTGRPVDVRTTVTEGPAAQVLLKAAIGADLLVVGSRGHGAFAGMLLGSVSQHCTQHAPCTVVVVPSDDDDAEATP